MAFDIIFLCRKIAGVLSLEHLLKKLVEVSITAATPVESVICGQFKRVSPKDTLSKLTYVLQGTPFALVVEEVKSGNTVVQEKLLGVATQMDLVTSII